MVLRSESITNSSAVSVSSVNLRSDYASSTIGKSTTTNIKTHYHHHNSKNNYNNKNNDWLKELGLPRGLRDTLLRNIQEVSSKRIWIIDNSGSMKMLDGHEILGGVHSIAGEENVNDNTNNVSNDIVNVINNDHTKLNSKMISNTGSSSSTRWAEAQETVNCHAQLSSVLGAPTDFHLLNKPSNGGPQKFRVGYDNANNDNNIINVVKPSMSMFRKRQSDSNRVEKIMNRQKPKGKTPLHEAILDARKEVIRMLPQLRADGMKVTIIICTDGCTDGDAANDNNNQQELENSLESLKGLPVCVVIRLCTDYGHVVDFYNGLDVRMSNNNNNEGSSSELLTLDVLDDYEAEAKQVYELNPWLNYALVLHRMREMGLQGSSELLDHLDQRSFTGDEIRSFCALLFGTTSDLLPDPLCDEDNFVSEIDILQKKEKQLHWNPNKKKMSPWIDIDELFIALQ
jgi:Mg-chelatase subunit ChlD